MASTCLMGLRRAVLQKKVLIGSAIVVTLATVAAVTVFFTTRKDTQHDKKVLAQAVPASGHIGKGCFIIVKLSSHSSPWYNT